MRHFIGGFCFGLLVPLALAWVRPPSDGKLPASIFWFFAVVFGGIAWGLWS